MELLSFFQRKPKTRVPLGDREVEVKPASFENMIRAAMLLAPHLARARQEWPAIKAAALAGGDRLVFVLVSRLMGSLESVPGDLTKAIALLIDEDATWLARFATAEQVMVLLAEIDKANDLGGLIMGILEFSEILTIDSDNGSGPVQVIDWKGT
jgi:hypothetical protein